MTPPTVEELLARIERLEHRVYVLESGGHPGNVFVGRPKNPNPSRLLAEIPTGEPPRCP